MQRATHVAEGVRDEERHWGSDRSLNRRCRDQIEPRTTSLSRGYAHNQSLTWFKISCRATFIGFANKAKRRLIYAKLKKWTFVSPRNLAMSVYILNILQNFPRLLRLLLLRTVARYKYTTTFAVVVLYRESQYVAVYNFRWKVERLEMKHVWTCNAFGTIGNVYIWI